MFKVPVEMLNCSTAPTSTSSNSVNNVSYESRRVISPRKKANDPIYEKRLILVFFKNR